MSASRQHQSGTSAHSRYSQSLDSKACMWKEDHQKIKAREWIREVLRKYLSKYVRDFLSQRKDIVPSPVTSSTSIDNRGSAGVNSSSISDDNPEDHLLDTLTDHSNSGPRDAATILPDKGKKLAEKNLKMGLKISELTITEETALGDDRISYLSRIVSLGVKYSVGGRPDHIVHWLVKLPSLQFDERNLARVTHVHKREVEFYATIVQQIKLWLEINTPETDDTQALTLNVPTCYFAYSQGSSDFDIDQEFEQFPNPEYTLVLDDLRTQGFGKRHYSIGLTVDEAIETLREIAKCHAIFYAMGHHSGPELIENWSQLLKLEDLYSLYLDMIRQGFRHLRRFRRDFINEKTLGELVDLLLNLETKLPTILQRLLRPLPPPAVNTLVHMDLWTDNLLFRDDSTSDSGNNDDGTFLSTSAEGSAETNNSPIRELDCMILDWQMVSYGRISHDLGILMMTSLDGSTRRENGMMLLKFYYETFEKIANSFKLEVPFQFSELIAQYKESCLLATLLSVSRLDLVVSEQSTLQRFFEALEDLRDEQMMRWD